MTCWLVTSTVFAQGGAPFPEGYPEPSSLGPSLQRLATAYPQVVRLQSLGKSLQGRDLWMAELGHARPEGAPPRPSILLVANLEADHVVGSLVAVGLVRRLAAADGQDPTVSALLDRVTVLVVPRLNPDGVERLWGRPGAPNRANLRPLDRDRDGRFAEDGPNDLDGDGLITSMRVFDRRATHLASEADPRIAHRADPAKGERARFREFTEGTDDDGDGRINEDPSGGVDLNRNWPHHWAEFDPEAGTAPASEPEVLALIRFAFDHPEIAILWNFGLLENLVEAPNPPFEDADKPILAELARVARVARESVKPPPLIPAVHSNPAGIRSVTPPTLANRADNRPAENDGEEGKPLSLESAWAGSITDWAYHQFGIPGLASRLWALPGFPPHPAGQPEPPAQGEARWLAWNDRLMGGKAFTPFSTFDHPTLGRVEIGGWKPGVRLNPPIEYLEFLVDEEFSVLKALAERLPSLTILDARAEKRAEGLYEVTAVIENSGVLPTALPQGVRTRQAPPVLVRFSAGTARPLAGSPLTRIDSLAGSGGQRTLRWMVLAGSGEKSVRLEASCPKAGFVARVLPLP